MDDLYARALVAYLRAEKREGGAGNQPAESLSGVEEHEGLQYVVLRNVGGTLAVYRVRPDTGLLRRMKRWPAVLDR